MINTPPTNHSLAPPIVPLEIPLEQIPFLPGTGANAIPEGSSAKAVPPNDSATDWVIEQGTVNPAGGGFERSEYFEWEENLPPAPSEADPGIAACKAAALSSTVTRLEY